MSASMIFGSYLPITGLLSSDDSLYKYILVHHLHPTDKVLEEAKQDWDNWQRIFHEQGDTHEYIPYPYTNEMIQGWMSEYSHRMNWPISVDGPPPEAQEKVMADYENNVKQYEALTFGNTLKSSLLHRGSSDD